ncbi:MAG: glycosyltransferase family 4 protein [Sedimentisphaerales bacterium]
MTQKVAIIIERLDTTLGGAERSVSELADALEAAGCETHILAAKGQPKSAKVHILCGDVIGKRTDLPVFAGALKKHINENSYDIIHSILPFDFADVYQPRGGTYAEAIKRNAASYGNKCIEVWKRATGFMNLRRNTLLKAEKTLCELKDGPAIIAISNYVAEQFKKHYGTEDSRIAVIPNGVDTKALAEANGEQTRKQIITQLNIRGNTKPVLFLFAANNFRLKGLTCLLKAFSQVSNLKSQISKGAYLIIVGSDNAVPYRRLATNLNIADNILFLGSVGNIGNLLAAADVAVLPTFYDPSSRFILEALALGKPVITTRFNGASEQFTDNRHGKVIDRPDNIAELAGALTHFTDSANIQKASQAILQDNIRQRVSISRVAGQLKEFYDGLTKRRRQ